MRGCTVTPGPGIAKSEGVRSSILLGAHKPITILRLGSSLHTLYTHVSANPFWSKENDAFEPASSGGQQLGEY